MPCATKPGFPHGRDLPSRRPRSATCDATELQRRRGGGRATLGQGPRDAVEIVAAARNEAESIRRQAAEAGRREAAETAQRMLAEEVARTLPALGQIVRNSSGNGRPGCRIGKERRCGWPVRLPRGSCAASCGSSLKSPLRGARGPGTGRRQPRPARLPESGRPPRPGRPGAGARRRHLAPGAAEVVADGGVTPGGCRVESRFGLIDQQIESQLKRIEDELLA